MKYAKLVVAFAWLALGACAGSGSGGGGVAGPNPTTDPNTGTSSTFAGFEVWQGGPPGCAGVACDGIPTLLTAQPDGTYRVQSDRKNFTFARINQRGISGCKITGNILASRDIFGGPPPTMDYSEVPPAGITSIGFGWIIFGGWPETSQRIMVRLTETCPGVNNPITADLVLTVVPRQ